MEESLRTDGAVIIFSTWHHVSLLPDDFLGEVVISTGSLREMNINQNVDDLPAIMMPLRRPKEPREGPYKVVCTLSLLLSQLSPVFL